MFLKWILDYSQGSRDRPDKNIAPPHQGAWISTMPCWCHTAISALQGRYQHLCSNPLPWIVEVCTWKQFRDGSSWKWTYDHRSYCSQSSFLCTAAEGVFPFANNILFLVCCWSLFRNHSTYDFISSDVVVAVKNGKCKHWWGCCNSAHSTWPTWTQLLCTMAAARCKMKKTPFLQYNTFYFHPVTGPGYCLVQCALVSSGAGWLGLITVLVCW